METPEAATEPATLETGAPRPLRRDPVALVGLLVLAVAGLWLTGRYALMYSIPFADTHTYLEVGRNLMEGRGLITRFNVYWGWSESLSYPALSYVNTLYGLPLGIAWVLLDDAGWVAVLFTAVPAVLNAVLIALLLRRAFGNTVALLSGAGYLILPATYHNIQLITAENPMVTMCLVLLLLVQRMERKGAVHWLLLGLMFGLFFLCRRNIFAAGPGVLLALLLVQQGGVLARLRATIRPIVSFALGALIVYGSFQLICHVSEGEWYPSIQRMVRPYKSAGRWGGEFVRGSPAVKVDPLPPEVANRGPWQRLQNIARNLQTYLKLITDQLGLLVLAVAAGAIGLNRAQGKHYVYLFCTAVMFLAMYLYASQSGDIARNLGSPMRYTQHIVPFLYPLGVIGLVRLAGLLRVGPRLRTVAVVLLWVLASLPHLVSVQQMQSTVSEMQEPRVAAMQRMAEAIRERTQPDDLVAVQEGGSRICMTTFLERPSVALPFEQMDNEHDMLVFMNIFHPKLVVPGTCRSAHQVLPRLGYTRAEVPSFELGRRPETIFVRPGD